MNSPTAVINKPVKSHQESFNSFALLISKNEISRFNFGRFPVNSLQRTSSSPIEITLMAPKRMSAGSKKAGKAAVEASPTESTGDVAVLTSASALMSLSHGPRCCGKQWSWQLVSTSFLKTLDGFPSTRKMTRSLSETQSYGSVLETQT